MVVSVAETDINPYYNLYVEDENENIHRAIPSPYTRRQDCPAAYIITGSIYVIQTNALKNGEISQFKNVRKIVTPPDYNIDLDTNEDWENAEKLIKKLF
jgi:CMP-N-acetylneuraminic acid synthetase